MLSSGLIKQVSDKWSLPDHQIQLNDIEKEAISNLVKILNVEWFSSSNTSELSTRIHKTEKETKLLLKISQDLGEIIQVDGNLLFTKTNYDLLINSLKTYFKSKDSINVAEFKELANTSRKYAVPLLEYLDKEFIQEYITLKNNLDSKCSQKKRKEYSRKINSEFNIISLLWHDNVLKMKGGRMYSKILEFLSSQEDVVLCNGIELVKKIKSK